MRSRAIRLRDALLIGVLAALANYLALYHQDAAGADFTYWWRAGHALLVGRNPYEVVIPLAARFPFDDFFRYPLPAAIVGIPFSLLQVRSGAALFVGCGFALAAYGLSATGHWRMGVLISAPAFFVFDNAQWMPLLLGAALLPNWGWLLASKPTLGAALLLWRPSWRTFWGGAAICIVGLMLLPSWPLDWLGILRQYPSGQYSAPVGFPGGILLLLVLLRWRRPEARLVAAMTCVPQNFFLYDQLPLMTIPASQLSLLLFAFWSHVLRAIVIGFAPKSNVLWPISADFKSQWFRPFILLGLYAPAAVMILLRPNEGDAPIWLERWLSKMKIPSWLAGRAGSPS